MAVTSSTSKQVGFSKTCINTINGLSGVGILSAPYALSSGGWLGLILLLLIVASAYFTGLLICRCMDSNPSITTYPAIAATAFGRKGRITASIIIYSELFLVAVGFLIIEGDNMQKLFPNFTLKLGNLKMDGRNSFTIVAGAMIFPSILLTDLGVLSYISFGGVISSIIIVAAVLCVGTTKGVGFHEKGNLVNFKGLPTALSLYTFSYGGHAMFPAIYNSMKKKSQFPKVLFLSFITCTIIYASMAIVGYLMYGHNIQSQVTLNLPKEKISSKVAIYTVLAGPIAKYALTIMPISTAIESCLPENYREKKPLRILIKMLLLVSTVVLAMLVPSFETATSLTGALLIVLVSFLLPCVCYLKIFKIYKHFGYELAGISGIILLAILVGVLGTYSAIAHIIKEA